MRRWCWLAAVLSGVVAVMGCAAGRPGAATTAYDSFDHYRRETVQSLLARRPAHGAAAESHALMNAPQEWRPQGPVRGGVLLIHGLGDSPWSFNDLGPALAGQGFLVRSVLLPGHGTVPADMLEVRLEDWRRTVDEQAALLRREGLPIYLGGFSTGANLALDHAHAHPDVAGLLLFSPAFRSSVPFGWVAPLLRHVRPWLVAPEPALESMPMRYSNMPTNGFAQYHRSSRLAQRALSAGTFDRPVFMVLAASDSVVDTPHAVAAFQTRFTHPASRLLWYGQPLKATLRDPRILTQPDALPDWRISQFSHMGVLFSPDNPQYGPHGAIRLCRNSREASAVSACEQASEVWYSEWGYQEPGKVHARLTFNPYFAWQAQQMATVLDAASAAPAAPLASCAAGLAVHMERAGGTLAPRCVE
jgi:alpha-beta hydrolase superfamily lysophospholipase